MNIKNVERKLSLTGVMRLFGLVITIIFLFSNFVAAESQSKDKSDNKSAAKYQGTFPGEWSGEVSMGETRPVNGVFTITISAEGTVSGTFSGLMSGTITGKVKPSGEINAKGSAGLSDWKGQFKIENGKLSASGTWEGYGGGGSWKSN
jgi:hypothetical protein